MLVRYEKVGDLFIVCIGTLSSSVFSKSILNILDGVTSEKHKTVLVKFP